MRALRAHPTTTDNRVAKVILSKKMHEIDSSLSD
jgi:hypothetical protein